jgi:hypothetical protein
MSCIHQILYGFQMFCEPHSGLARESGCSDSEARARAGRATVGGPSHGRASDRGRTDVSVGLRRARWCRGHVRLPATGPAAQIPTLSHLTQRPPAVSPRRGGGTVTSQLQACQSHAVRMY